MKHSATSNFLSTSSFRFSCTFWIATATNVLLLSPIYTSPIAGGGPLHVGRTLAPSAAIQLGGLVLPEVAHVAGPPQAVLPAAQDPLERVPELGREDGVDDRVERRVEVAQPQTHAHRDRRDVTGGAGRQQDRDDEERQPAAHERPRNDGQRFGRLPFPLRVRRRLVLLLGDRWLRRGRSRTTAPARWVRHREVRRRRVHVDPVPLQPVPERTLLRARVRRRHVREGRRRFADRRQRPPDHGHDGRRDAAGTADHVRRRAADRVVGLRGRYLPAETNRC